jgi:hypothetical protein
MANRIKIKRSGTAGVSPPTEALDHGELALNYADGKLFYKDSNNTIQQLNASSSSGLTNLDGGRPDTEYGGVTSIDCGGV